MDKLKLNYFVDLGLLISFICVTLTGIIKWPGLLTWFGLSYSQLPMAFLSSVHDWSGLVMALLVLVHLILHWKWIVMVTKKICRGKNQ